MAKHDMNTDFTGSAFWTAFLSNDWTTMSNTLKTTHSTSTCLECLHSAYLIDSVTTRCNKHQSVNFLVDQSGSVGAVAFQSNLDFLDAYISQTYDDISMSSIHFFASTFEEYAAYGNNRTQMLNLIRTKSYNAGGTYTGLAINETITRIQAGGYQNGVPKLMVVMTDGGSADSVIESSNYARSLGITMFCIGVGSNINNAQLLEIA